MENLKNEVEFSMFFNHEKELMSLDPKANIKICLWLEKENGESIQMMRFVKGYDDACEFAIKTIKNAFGC